MKWVENLKEPELVVACKKSVTCGTKRKFAEVNASLVLNFGI